MTTMNPAGQEDCSGEDQEEVASAEIKGSAENNVLPPHPNDLTSPSQHNKNIINGQPLALEATRQDLLHCQFSSWFPTFRHLPQDERYQNRSNVTIKSKILATLPVDFWEFLLSDGIRLPKGATQLSSCAPNEAQQKDGNDDCDDDDDTNAWNNDNTEEGSNSLPIQHSFPQLNQQISNAMEALGGAVAPKLNWSTPKDATWVNEGTLKCKTPGDVYLLLKSSDFCMHDLQTLKTKLNIEGQQTTKKADNDNDDDQIAKTKKEEGMEILPRLELVLRKWCNFYPSMEFRCFVRNHIMIGISQRNHTQHYPHLLIDRYRLRSFALEFFEDVICHRFADNQLSNYVFDIYIDKSDRVWLLDFNVWSLQTDALLYSWEELVDMPIPLAENSDWPELRIVETALEVRHDPLASYRAPVDTVELASSTARQQQERQQAAPGGATTFESFMAMCQKPSERDASSISGDDTGDNA